MSVLWKIDDADYLPLGIIEDTEDGIGVVELGKRTPEKLAFAEQVVREHNAHSSLVAALEAIETIVADERIQNAWNGDKAVLHILANKAKAALKLARGGK